MGPTTADVMVSWVPGMEREVRFVSSGRAAIHCGAWRSFASNGTKRMDAKLYLSHLSASVGVLPIEAAAGTRNGSVAGINDRTGMWLRGVGEGIERVGVVILDFPGRELIRQVLGRN